MRGNTIKAVITFALVFGIITVAGWYIAPFFLGSGPALGREIIARITVEGMITGGSGGGSPLVSDTMASAISVADKLYQARDDGDVCAVVRRVNSPGGSAAGSDEIYHAVASLAQQKPVVVSMGDVAASGGYYIAAPASYIYANGATLTGSIGVRFSLLNWEELANKLGIEDVTLTAGEYKDIGSPWRDMSTQERDLLSEMIDEVHEQFIRAVDEGRENLDEAQVRELATGMIFTGERACEAGLVDELGGLYAAEAKARELADVGTNVVVEEYGTTSLWDELFAIRSQTTSQLQLGATIARDPLWALSQGLYLNTLARDIRLH